jgi:hypothetical protein
VNPGSAFAAQPIAAIEIAAAIANSTPRLVTLSAAVVLVFIAADAPSQAHSRPATTRTAGETK